MTELNLRSTSSLYTKLLGESWTRLDAAVRRLHALSATIHAVGIFRVRHGSNWLARKLARLARLPAAREAVDIELLITVQQGGEERRRMFAGRPLVSMQVT